MQSFPKHIIHWETKRQIKNCLTCPAQTHRSLRTFFANDYSAEDVTRFPLEQIHSNRDCVRKAREAFLVDMRSQS